MWMQIFRLEQMAKCRLGAIHKGRPQRRGRGYGQMRTGGGVQRTLRTSARWHFLELFQHALQTLPVGDGY